MTATSSEWTAQVVEHTRRLEEYRETISSLFPALPRDLVDARSIRDVDALVLALFLRCYPHELSVLEVGTFFGIATFHFAGQPSVLRVLGVDPDLSVTEDAGETSSIDIARAALAEFADESVKIHLRTGDLSRAWTNLRGDTHHSSGAMPAQELSEDEPLLAFVGGARTREAVDADLQAIFDANPRAVVILDHCRGDGGLFVQAGIADCMERARGKYHFRLFGDLTSGMATSNLGIVYPHKDSAEVQRSLAELAHLFSERLDPLWLASREQELIGIVSTYREEADTLRGQHQNLIDEHQLLVGRNTELQKRISQLEKRKTQLEKRKTQLEERNAGLTVEKKGLQSHTSQLERRISQLEKRTSQLEERNSRLKEERLLVDSKLRDYRTAGRYKLADAVTKNVLRIPGAKAVARRTRPKE
ncbi:MAG TPA: hypothetical protein VNB93_05975 [Rubrobacter sp.]|nr:hypothetical protein [Rubrobacter sp.]